MEIASDAAHRLLFYVQAVTRRGYKLTVPEFEAYAKAPSRKMKTVPGGPFRTLADLTAMMESKNIPTESWLECLTRLQWLSIDADRVNLTNLGKALLDELTAPKVDADLDSATEVLLDPADPHAYVKVVGVLADLGEGVLVDPYFRYEQLEVIVEHTQIRRILTSRKTGNTAISQIQFALAVIDESQRPEVRVASALHDRFAIGDGGSVIAIGTSLNSVGKNHSVVVPLSDTAGKAVSSVYEDIWNQASPLPPTKASNNTP